MHTHSNRKYFQEEGFHRYQQVHPFNRPPAKDLGTDRGKVDKKSPHPMQQCPVPCGGIAGNRQERAEPEDQEIRNHRLLDLG